MAKVIGRRRHRSAHNDTGIPAQDTGVTARTQFVDIFYYIRKVAARVARLAMEVHL